MIKSIKIYVHVITITVTITITVVVTIIVTVLKLINKKIVYFIMVDLVDYGKVVINYKNKDMDLNKVILLLWLFIWNKEQLDGMLMVNYKHNLIHINLYKVNIRMYNGYLLLICVVQMINWYGKLDNDIIIYIIF